METRFLNPSCVGCLFCTKVVLGNSISEPILRGVPFLLPHMRGFRWCTPRSCASHNTSTPTNTSTLIGGVCRPTPACGNRGGALCVCGVGRRTTCVVAKQHHCEHRCGWNATHTYTHDHAPQQRSDLANSNEQVSFRHELCLGAVPPHETPIIRLESKTSTKP